MLGTLTVVSLGGGIASLVMGLLLLIFPQSVLAVVMTILGVLILLFGLYQLVRVFLKRSDIPQWSLISGAVCAILGCVLLFAQRGSLVFFSWVVGIGAILFGIFQLAGMTWRAQVFLHGPLSWVPGVISLLFGLLSIFLPMVGVQLQTMLVGIYLIYLGLYAIVIYLSVRNRV
nr:DUF308 domain-containing protein [Maliibacterium massiliense]